MKYVSFPLHPLKAALSLSKFSLYLPVLWILIDTHLIIRSPSKEIQALAGQILYIYEDKKAVFSTSELFACVELHAQTKSRLSEKSSARLPSEGK
jgi:hypothetical protein